ncbi:MAG TPA: four helix bundle protein [Anaerolineales bacterium]|nr:four helix bundle protein [Anaerolineales bacterium]
MAKLEYAASFRDLIVYRKARELALEIFRLTKHFPREEAYSLTDQIRRSSRSTGAQIAEAWAKRRYEKHFVSKLTDSDGEQQETQHWIETAFDCEYISKEEAKALLLEKCMEIGRLLGGMMAKAEQFCNPSPYQAREEEGKYFVTSSQQTKN